MRPAIVGLGMAVDGVEALKLHRFIDRLLAA